MADILALAAAALIVTTVTIHSLLGERRLIGPMLAQRGGVLDDGYARTVVRFAWHFTSAIGLVVAAALVAVAMRPDVVGMVVLISGGVIFTAAGLIDGIATRGRHVGWPFLTLIGLVCLGAYWMR